MKGFFSPDLFVFKDSSDLFEIFHFLQHIILKIHYNEEEATGWWFLDGFYCTHECQLWMKEKHLKANHHRSLLFHIKFMIRFESLIRLSLMALPRLRRVKLCSQTSSEIFIINAMIGFRMIRCGAFIFMRANGVTVKTINLIQQINFIFNNFQTHMVKCFQH